MKKVLAFLHRVVGLLFLIGIVFSIPSSIPISKAQAPAPNQGGYLLYLPSVGKSEPPLWLKGPYGGSIVALAIDPKNDNVVYGGSSGAGVFKSTNGGISWINTSTGLGSLTFDSLAVDPVNPNNIYAGSHGFGIFKSTDGGSTWKAVNNGIAADSVVYSITVNPGNSNLVYAGTRIQNTLNGVLYKSVDGGASWNSVLNTTNDWIYSISVNPGSPNVVLIAEHEHGVYQATDYGNAGGWHESNTGICGDECRKGRNVAYNPKTGNPAIYTAWHGDLFRSTNGGGMWSQADSGLGASYVYPNGVSFNPSNLREIYLANWKSDVGGIVKSTNEGNSWSGSGLRDYIVYSVVVPKGSGSTVLAGTNSNGLYRSTNGGGNWSQSSTGISNTQVTGIAFPGNSVIIASTAGSGVQRTTDNGGSWTNFSSGLDDQIINSLVMNPANRNILFALTQSKGLRKIDVSAGSNWSSAADIIPDTQSYEETEPNQQPVFRITRREVIDEMIELEGEEPLQIKSKPVEQGNDVEAASSPLVDKPSISMAFAPSNSNIAYLGTGGSGVFRSTNNGNNWSSTGSIGSGDVVSIAVSPNDPNQVYAVLVNNSIGKVKYSSNGGNSWTENTPSGVSVNAVAVSPIDGTVEAATSSGLWQYNGSGWSAIQFQGSNVSEIAASPFRAGTFFAAVNQAAYSVTGSYSKIIAEDSSAGLEIQSFNFDPSDPTHLYIGTMSRGAVRVSTP
jgi:photosystem II stability/assembly factor-like uncharacterized protein